MVADGLVGHAELPRDLGVAGAVGLVLGAAIVLGTALVFGLAVRLALRKGSARTAAWAALALGVVTVLSVVVFWRA